MADIAHASRAHAKLSASGTERWWNCARSALLSEGAASVSSVYAEEGTAAHELANVCLEFPSDAHDHVGRVFNQHRVTAEMADAVQVYVDHCRQYRPDEGWEVHFERRFSLDALNPPVPMFGTADFVAYHPAKRRLVVVDYKHGRGILVKVAGNKQLRYYALGMLLTLPEGAEVETVEIAIVQPRAPGGGVNREEFPIQDLHGFSDELMRRAHATQAADAPMAAGAWCRFCPVSGRCPEQAAAAVRLAQDDFEADLDAPPALSYEEALALMDGAAPKPQGAKPEAPSPCRQRNASLLTPAELGAVLAQARFLKDWIASVESAALALLRHGAAVPGWKLVPKRPQRRWADPDKAAAALMRDFGLTRDQAHAVEVLSPAQAEAAVAASSRPLFSSAKEAKEHAKAWLADLIVSESSDLTLAPDSDDRTAAGAASEFDIMPEPQMEQQSDDRRT